MKRIKLSLYCLAVSIFTVVVFHFPFFRHACAHVDPGFNGVLIIASLSLLMLAINYLATYLILWLGRLGGRVLLAVSFICDAAALYFINTYDVMLDDTMMGNVYNTNGAEAGGYFSGAALLYLLLCGVLPAVLTFLPKIEFGSLRRFFCNLAASLGLGLVIGFGNITNWPWIDNNSTVLGSLILPWSYVVNTFRWKAAEKRNNREEIKLPDATVADDGKAAVVLIIGESARRDHFSLYGYERETNPELSRVPGLHTYIAKSAATYTTAGVKAILDYAPTDKLYETLPNYLFRAGVDVEWRTSNWGQSTLHIDKFVEGNDWDIIRGLDSAVTASSSDKVLIILHTSTSHGPSYEKRYPSEFEVFRPVNHCVEMSKADHDELMNSYDNSILYTDHLIADAIRQMKSLPAEWRSAVIYISDHGESLGEGNLYMHGVPIAIAPREQYEIPFIVWCSDGRTYKEIEDPGQYNVFHSVLNYLSIDSPVYDEQKNIFNSR